jgi:hypothetical protein
VTARVETRTLGSILTQDTGVKSRFEEDVLTKILLSRARAATLEYKNEVVGARLNHNAILMGGVLVFQSQEDCHT